ncbi:alanine--tRNA ligase [Marinagarivorans cellulosilyticus]|uniref:Alanine--tRNA ligase n=1 Tax=Marinagarivorans cellulosilyticus TaxID=2721545 RepID=A0AAN1WII4_9GAMM|nr:alanine--tRNA ligase [Marinagarivorans cellulosilyticus]BCD98241.1 alanyl-tRNA synthetase [Marinagarivorans cellulosilyticus]
MQSSEIRQAFLDFFASKGHQVVASSSLVPGNDPTLLFTNAGMNQFKDVFLGSEQRDYSRATSSQRCVRAGGKHNDLENVGYTARHHTFFEMLGNFSFGDYFKRDAIFFAWEFLTKVMALPPEKLWVTVHISDDEAADIWQKEVGVSPERFSRLDEDNFWQMGDTGPCGPSSEIFYDHGADVPGGPPGSENDDLDRYIEIWNLVFMQYERQASGELIALPKPSVDTGMGLERISAIKQGVHTNYEIDIFQALIKAAAERCNCNDLQHKSLRVIADHIRSCGFLVADGVIPSNEGRGYVLRRIIRRAIRHGHKLGQKGLFFADLVPALVEQMGGAYPDLVKAQAQVQKVLRTEEEQFAKTLDKGMKILEEQLTKLDGTVLPGDLVFKLHDTFGFPVDLTNDIARERDLSIDLPAYEELMKAQKASAGGDQFQVDYTKTLNLEGQTRFEGYENLAVDGRIVALVVDGEPAESATAGDSLSVVLDRTAFYANSGGQVGDTGYLTVGDARFEVHDCRKAGDHFLHIGVLQKGSLAVGTTATAIVDAAVREATALNHSATHLAHAALRQVLGEHVAQKGSLVDSKRLRFDFAHFEALTTDELSAVELLVNQQIRANTPVETQLCNMEEAKAKGAMALFGEKYGDTVRVLSMGVEDFSIELCGGTHVKRTGDIGLFKIISEAGIAAGVRRIEAVTGEQALDYVAQLDRQLAAASAQLKASPEQLSEKLSALIQAQKDLTKEVTSLKGRLAGYAATEWLSEAVEVNGIKVLAKRTEGLDANAQLDAVDQLKNKLGAGVVLLVNVDDDKASLIAGVTKAESKRYKAGDLIRDFAQKVGGKGGGRPDMARGACPVADNLDQAIAGVVDWVEKQA